MSTPLINQRLNIDKVSFLRDSEDPNLWYYFPFFSNWSKVERKEFGPSIVEYLCSTNLHDPQILEKFKIKFSNYRVSSLRINSWDKRVNLSINVPSPHKVSLNYMNGNPYLNVILQITLMKNDPTFLETEQLIKQKIQEKTILEGQIEGTFNAYSAAFEGEIVLDYKSLSTEFMKFTDNQVVQDNVIFARINEFVSKNFTNLFLIRSGNISPIEKSKLENIIFSDIKTNLISRSMIENVFDQAAIVNKVILKHPNEFSEGTKKIIISTSQLVNEKLIIEF
jgi:hypothetical protein